MLHRRLGESILAGAGSALLKTAVASLCMALAVWCVLYLSGRLALADRYRDLAGLCAAVPLGAVVYVLAAKLLRTDMLSSLVGVRSARHSIPPSSGATVTPNLSDDLAEIHPVGGDNT